MSVLPLKYIIVSPLSPSTIMPGKTTLGSFSVVHNCCLSCVRRPMPYILIFSAVRLVPFFLRPKTSCIAKKGPSPRYARKSKFPLYSSIHFPSSHPPVMATLGRVVFPASALLFYWLAKSQPGFFSLCRQLRLALNFSFFLFLFWLFLLFFGLIPRDSIIYIFAIFGIYFSLPTLRSGRVNYVGVGCFFATMHYLVVM